MPKFLSSVSVVLGAVIAALQGLTQSGYLSYELTAAITAALSGLLVLARFRPGAGASITGAQAKTPN